MPVQSDSVLVIGLSPRRLAAAELHFVGGALQVSALGDVQVPEGAFDMGQLADGELLGRAIAGFMVEKRITAKRAVMVLPEANAITQLQKLPQMPEEDMLGAVRSVAERYAVFAEHEISVDACVAEELEEDGNPMSSVLFAACRLATVEQCQECARAAGLELVAVEVGPIAAARAYRERFMPTEAVALAVVGEMKTDVMIFDRGVLKLCYSANAGLPEQSEGGEWISPAPEQRDPFAPPPQLYSELTHCFRFFQNQFPGRGVERVLVVADHPKADLLASHLAEQLQLPVELGHPAYEMRLPMEVDERAAATTRALSLAEFRGGALSALSEGAVFLPVNLLPVVRTFRLLSAPALRNAIIAMAVLLILSVVWAISMKHNTDRQQRELATVERDIQVLQPELDMLRAIKQTEEELRSEVERQTARIAKERAVRWSQILVDVAERFPEGMWLTQINSPDTTKISFTGMAVSRELIPQAIEALSGSPYLGNVVLGSLTKDDQYAPGRTVIRFQINAALRRGQMLPLGERAPTAAGVTGGEEATR